jgi:hypothetical protein
LGRDVPRNEVYRRLLGAPEWAESLVGIEPLPTGARILKWIRSEGSLGEIFLGKSKEEF